ncbi:hypothetical protein EMIHUDRAFT_448373, partial [Emiliania huxleyi CCMP1516]|uniref:Calcineurin-like phosphoesterase domain-containing protein n=2 Tax=Emiliania huxleyi TaxID=2903 RepID=A0A0D3IDY2_EMIH1
MASLEPSRMAPVTVRRAWRSYLGEFDGDTEDEDEYVADVRAAKRQKAAAPAQRRDVVTLHPRGSRAVTVVATADLHRHHEEEYIGGLSLAGWFESDRSPAHVDVCLFAGDVGLETEAESTSRAQTRPDGATLDSWRRLLGRVLAAKPGMHVVLVGGNHDGLLCRDADCLACARLARHDPAAARQGGEAPPLHDEGRAAASRLRRLLSGLPGGRVHVLCDEAADLDLPCGAALRVVGSPWTSYDTGGKAHQSISHHWRPEGGFLFGGVQLQQRLDCAAWWRRHWCRVGHLLSARETAGGRRIAGSLLCTHTPPRGVLDIVGGGKDNGAGIRSRRVGCAALREMLEGLERPPVLHCFGHVHARQSEGEPAAGPRLAASKRCAGTLFANVAAERQLPEITGFRLARRGGGALGAGGGARLALPAPGAAAGALPAGVLTMPPISAADYARVVEPESLLMRPPTVLTLPLSGWACDCESWREFWELS